MAVLVALPLVAALGTAGVLAVRSFAPGDDSVDGVARASAERFLDEYMDDDGRVVRRDQGGDTVSEGQAYAMLMAVALEDRERFDLAWTWARENLRRDDGLLSFLWREGKIVDPEAAADADLDVAWALALAAERFGIGAYRAEARRIAAAVLRQETVDANDRGPVLVAGPWARGEPKVLNPSYFSPGAYAALGAADRERYDALSASSRSLLGELMRGEPGLPPDWAEIDAAGRARPVPAPGRKGEQPLYSLDAARVPVRMAASCEPADRRVAASLWPFLEREAAGEVAQAYRLDGERLDPNPHPLSAVAAAAAAGAAGDEAAQATLLDRAQALERRSPTYYGAAWVALGRLMLTSDRLTGCPGGARSGRN